ncbi:ATP phosphoribosyltransferase regulatory subunit [Bacillus oleivorans]|uniref:ATP phosphoribosyltransferase regulatory subunit n=1 Tax=Bacillus oleivorans TaxID=1448271 RepID=A0A285CYI9_9BACI|nr:ATP phosphoribosyltransferase regulatory subunit [Bacillus oleivorans]SNX72610.1 ATP phosphoribosyltransferase regulatory subunit [Bacillus oleivorans]
MTKTFMFEKPLGMRDTLPELYRTKRKVIRQIEAELKSWGYQMIETPTLEYYETTGRTSAIDDQKLFKLLDQQGHTLVLRPDMTAPIARVAASKLAHDSTPLRLSYQANVFRSQQREGGRPAEFSQAGVELIGDSTISADGEVIALLVSTLQKAGLDTFTLAIGHVKFVDSFFLEVLGTEERVQGLKRFLFEKNYVGYREHIQSLSLSSIDKERLNQFLNLIGDESIIDRAKELTIDPVVLDAIQQLETLFDILCDYGVKEYIKLDLTLVSHMTYYTGILFEAYANQVGFPIGNGGRYDKLVRQFGVNEAATGFGIYIDRLLEALQFDEETDETILIIYSAEHRKVAIGKAIELRNQGDSVIIQDISGIKDLDKFVKPFAEVYYFFGERGRDS